MFQGSCFFVAGFYSPEWWKKQDEDSAHDCTVEQLEKAVQGYFTADALPLSLSNKPGISGKVSQKTPSAIFLDSR